MVRSHDTCVELHMLDHIQKLRKQEKCEIR